jgi:hypothetical protein
MYNLAMNKTYAMAMRIRIVGIVVSIVSLILAIIRPFEPVFNVGLVYFLLILSAVLIIVGQLIVIKFVPDEEFVTVHQRREAIYDVITTGLVMLIFIAIYVVPFVIKYAK